MTIREALNQAVIILKNENVDAPKTKSRELLASTLNTTKEYLMIYDNIEITSKQRERFINNVKKLTSGIPLQYITGKQEFMKMNFLVNKYVLIPQPDTEILVEEVIDILKKIKNPVVLDLCTGSGAIAISIAKYVENVKVYATDISSKALIVAKNNAELNGVLNSVKFIKSDLFENIKNQKFDVIISNPPYIETDVIKTLSKEVQNEPRIALDGGKDGLKFYKKISENAYKYLNRQGYLCLEIGYNQKKSVLKILEGQKRYVNSYCKNDLCGNDRIIITQIG